MAAHACAPLRTIFARRAASGTVAFAPRRARDATTALALRSIPIRVIAVAAALRARPVDRASRWRQDAVLAESAASFGERGGGSGVRRGLWLSLWPRVLPCHEP